MAIIGIERRTDESPIDYHKRLVYGKLVDKTLADLDYTELAEQIYGQSYSSDVARRMMYGSRKTLDLIEQEERCSVTDSSQLKEIDSKIEDLQRERQRFYDQRRELNKIKTEFAREEHLFECLAACANNLSNTVGITFDREFCDRLTESVKLTGNEAVLVLSDWHYGLVADNIFNKYNTDICKSRVKKIVSDTIQRILINECSKLHIVILGDLFHGAIHTSARVASEELACDQLMQVSEVLAQAIEHLSYYVKDVCIYMTYGNHARTVQNKNDSIHRDNMERIIPWWLEQRLSHCENIIIAPSEEHEFIFVNACGHNICATHGDLDSVRSAPRLLATLLQKKKGIDIECIILGDKHHRESFDELGVTALLCGSLCGADDYANGKRLYSDPSQLLLIISPECGVDAEYRLKCN